MMIEVNGSPRQVEATNLAAALEQLGWGQAHVATALNGLFVSAPARPLTPLSAGDRLEVLTAMQGG